MKKYSLIVISIAIAIVCVVAVINLLILKQSGDNKQNIIPTQKTGIKINIFPQK